MRKMYILILLLITGTYGIYLISSVCNYIYMRWDGSKTVAGQMYYISSLDMQSFGQKYEYLCSNDSIEKYYTSPYHKLPQKIRFFIRNGDNFMYCTYYSKSSNILIKFDVRNREPLEVFFYAIELCQKDDDSPVVAYNINDGWNLVQNNKYLTVFEREILNKICVYRRDQLQGLLCWNANFFERNILYVILIGITFIILWIKFGSRFSYD